MDATEEAILADEEETLVEAEEARMTTPDVEEEALTEADEETVAVLLDALWDTDEAEKAELVPDSTVLDDPGPKEPPEPPPIPPLGADPIDMD
jgi:hypothetical protein